MANGKYLNIFVLSFLDRLESIEHDLSYLKSNVNDPSNLPKCPVCGKQVSYEEEKNETVPDISIGEFKMMSTENKAKVLKKRANDFSKKDGSEDRKRFYQEKAIKNVLNYK